MEHVLDLLEAYHDGELHGRQLRRVEEHLAQCKMCREELASLEAFSALLQESPSAEEGLRPHQKRLMRGDQFVSQVVLRLPRRSEQAVPRSGKMMRRALETGWRLIPVGLFGTLAFVQALFIVMAGVLLAQSLPATANWLSPVVVPAAGGSLWDSAQCFASNSVIEAVLCLANYVDPLVWPVLLGIVVFVVIGLLYVSWLASWWIRSTSQPA